MTGDLGGDLFVQLSSGKVGGRVNFSIDGDVGGDITAADVGVFSIFGNTSGTIDIGFIESALVIGDLFGSCETDAVTGSVEVDQICPLGSLTILGGLGQRNRHRKDGHGQ